MSLRDGYELNAYGYQRAGGLVALLQQAIEQQRLSQQGQDPWLLNAAPSLHGSNSKAPQDLLQMLVGPAKDRDLTIDAADDAKPLDEIDPNFRQLSRLGMSRPLNRVDASDQYGRWSNTSTPSLRGAGPDALVPATPSAELPAQTSAPSQVAMVAATGRLIPWEGGGSRGFGGNTVGGPGISIPKVDWSETVRKIFQMLPLARLGAGGGGGQRKSGDDNDDYCGKPMAEETSCCWAGKDEYVHPDYLYGCLDRAKDRWRMCLRNGGKPDASEPPEWGPADEETWRNFHR